MNQKAFDIPLQLNYTEEEIDALVADQQLLMDSGITRLYDFRRGQLGALRKALLRFENEIAEALHTDLRKGAFEAYATEMGPVLKEISYTINRLHGWMRPARKGTPISFLPSGSKIVYEPRGIALIISPWNYPLLLCISPLINAIAAGNTAILKPSEMAPATAAVITQLISETFEPNYIATITGPGHLVTGQLIERHPLGLVFFTGSTRVGSLIMQAAAKQLSPVVLELGGKSPCVVAADASLKYAAKKIVFAKFLNAGQTCVAPDYLLVHQSIREKLISEIITLLKDMYGNDASQSPDYGRIINLRRFAVLQSYLKQGRLLFGGEVQQDDLFIAPTLLEPESTTAPIMQEEIFGPILPILTYQTFEEAKAIIQQHPNPLALYVFTNNKVTERFFMEGISFGGGCVNNGVIHLGNPELPFGGIGNSGMGMYHGHHGFLSFSHAKSIMKSPTWADAPVWYPPHQPWHLKLLKKLMR